MRKTVSEISVERSLDRSTLLKAAQRGVFGEAARKSGDTWLIDDESEAFSEWLIGSAMGRPRTIHVQAPLPPAWVNTEAARYTWKHDDKWRANAAIASKDEVGAEQYRQFLLSEADRMYNR